nr:PREDICTED: uncharacterized protein MAL8P1.12-like isoform X1 [Linepithema humile]
MPLLAESRRKQKVSLNPRGKWWTEDTNKFGQKMLEKMGWTKGKGLGANEQGIAEYSIKSMQKTRTAGIGYDENLEKWTEHHDKFSGILKHLQENQDIVQKIQNKDDSNKQSIELKSKESRARVHYHKFTRSKDINKYKLKDLANIFGREELSSKIQTKIEEEKNNHEEEVTETRDNWHGVVTINGGNMAEYFKLKSNYKNVTNHFKGKSNNLSSNVTDNQAIDSKSENEQHVGFGFVSNTENTLSSNYEISKDSSEKSNYAFDNPCLRLNSTMETINTDSSSKKSLKKKKKKLETDNLYTDEINKHDTREKLETETIDNCSDFSSNHGISKDSSEKNSSFDNPCLKLNNSVETTNTDGSSKKSSKKRKKELETDNSNIDEINKHDTRKKLKAETIDSNCGFSSNYEKSKDSSEENSGFDNPCLKLNNSVETTSTDGSSKKSSKKRKKELETDNSYTDEINKHDTRKKLKTETIDSNCSGFSFNYEISKDSSDKSNVFDNPCLKLNNPMEITSTYDSSEKSSKKKKKKKKELETNNLSTDEINEHDTSKKLETEIIDSNCNDFSSNCGISKDSSEKSNYAFDNPCLKLNSPTEPTSSDGSFKKSSKKKKKKELETNNLSTDEINERDTRKKLETETIDSNCNDFSSNCGISKDSSEKSNYAFDNPCLKLNSPMEITSTYDSSEKSSKKKKKKKKEFETNNLSTDEINEHDTRKKLETETIDSNCNDFSSNCGISKNLSEKSNYAFDNPCLRLNSPTETTSTDDSSKKSSKKKKKKDLKTNNLSTDEINEHDTRKKLETETIDSNCSGFSSNYEISKDSSEKSNHAFDNPCLRLNSPTETTTGGSSKKSAKKKRKKTLETDNLYTDEINKHDTRKKLETETIDSNCNGFTNPALDLKPDPKEDCNGKEFEISRAQFGLENCGLDLTDEKCDKKRVTFNDRIMLYEFDENSIRKKKGKHTLDKFEVENKKHKKKQKKCESITSSVCQEDTEKLAKKDKKHKKSKNKNAFNDENNPNSNIEITVNNIQQGRVENVKLTDIFPESYKVISVSNESVGTTHSSSNTKVRMSKKMLITLFHKNAISDFPGSNIFEIKGYGTDVEY